MVKIVLTSAVLLFGALAQAEYANIDKCMSVALSDLRTAAEAQDAKLLDHTVQVDEINDKWFNPWKYVWYSAVAQKRDGSRITLKDMKQVDFRGANACKKPVQFKMPKVFDFAADCKPGATKILQAMFKADGDVMNAQSVAVDEISDQPLNPIKYVWYRADGKNAQGKPVRKTTMMQKSYIGNDQCANRKEPSESSPQKTNSSNSVN